jgi:hypothetical protein
MILRFNTSIPYLGFVVVVLPLVEDHHINTHAAAARMCPIYRPLLGLLVERILHIERHNIGRGNPNSCSGADGHCFVVWPVGSGFQNKKDLGLGQPLDPLDHSFLISFVRGRIMVHAGDAGGGRDSLVLAPFGCCSAICLRFVSPPHSATAAA